MSQHHEDEKPSRRLIASIDDRDRHVLGEPESQLGLQGKEKLKLIQRLFPVVENLGRNPSLSVSDWQKRLPHVRYESFGDLGRAALRCLDQLDEVSVRLIQGDLRL